MRYALPIWHCLDKKSKLVLLDALERIGETEFNEPQPIWQKWLAEKCEQQYCYLPKGHDGLHRAVARISDIMAGHRQPETWTAALYEVDKLMRQPPSRSRG